MKQRPPLTPEQLEQMEKQGELIQRDPLRYSFLFQLEWLNQWDISEQKAH